MRVKLALGATLVCFRFFHSVCVILKSGHDARRGEVFKQIGSTVVQFEPAKVIHSGLVLQHTVAAERFSLGLGQLKLAMGCRCDFVLFGRRRLLFLLLLMHAAPVTTC